MRIVGKFLLYAGLVILGTGTNSIAIVGGHIEPTMSSAIGLSVLGAVLFLIGAHMKDN